VSGFGAFATSLASRVGVGNIVGVATAIVIGGPGAVFWMWVVAAVGMATSFSETTLAQVFKTRDGEQFRGGPAYYITRGLGWKRFGVVVAALGAFAYTMAFGPIQANAMAGALEGAFGVAPMVAGTAIAVLAGIVVIGGIRRIARIAELVVPFMAVAYLVIAAAVLVLRIDAVPAALSTILTSAFGLQAVAGGAIGGGMALAIQMGVARGLFSNEAGLGTTPNAAAAAHVRHPVRQGLVQGFGVFIDTIVICTATALIILLSGTYTPGMDPDAAGTLTSQALTAEIGSLGGLVVTVAILFFAFTSIIAIAYFAETNLAFLGVRGRWLVAARLAYVAMLLVGSVRSLTSVWGAADTFLGAMALVNLVAVLAMTPVVLRVLRDYESQRALGIEDPQFDPAALDEPIRGLDEKAWPAAVPAPQPELAEARA
jgi:AGCS family alanine or glycine:cation symporter